MAETVAGKLSDADITAVMDEIGVTEESNLIGVLQNVQERLSYLPPAALQEIARRMAIPLSRIYGVVTFYAQFYTEPRGRHTIRCCRGTACHVKGSRRVISAVERTLGISEGETTPDLLFYLETVACLGTCFLAPAMMIDEQYFGKLTPQRVEKILTNYGAPGGGCPRLSPENTVAVSDATLSTGGRDTSLGAKECSIE